MSVPKTSVIGVRAMQRALEFVGVKEHPPGSNEGPYNPKKKGGITSWQIRTNGTHGYPWCSAFLCSMLLDVGFVVTEPRKAAVGFFEQWAVRLGYIVVRPRRGDIVCYRFDSDNWPDHIGFVVRVLALRWRGGKFVGWIKTVEGNTASGNDANGGQVQIRYRWCDGRQKFARIK